MLLWCWLGDVLGFLFYCLLGLFVGVYCFVWFCLVGVVVLVWGCIVVVVGVGYVVVGCCGG